MTHHCLHAPTQGQAAWQGRHESHSMLGSPVQRQLGRRAMCCVQDLLGYQGFGLQRHGQAAWLLSKP